MDFLKALIPIVSPRNYTEMIRYIASWAFWVVLASSFFLRTIPPLDTFLLSIENALPIQSALSLVPAKYVNVAGIFLAFCAAALSHIVQLHDRLSDVFGIRRRFDRNNILLPLVIMAGACLSPDQIASLGQHRMTKMREVFYKYASSRAEKPLVDKHDIEQALAAWAWYWVLLETLFFLTIFMLVSVAFGDPRLLIGFLGRIYVCLVLDASSIFQT